MIGRSSVYRHAMPKRTLDSFFPAVTSKKANVTTSASVAITPQVTALGPVASGLSPAERHAAAGIAGQAVASPTADAAPESDPAQPKPAGTAAADTGPADWHDAADRYAKRSIPNGVPARLGYSFGSKITCKAATRALYPHA